MESGNDGVDFGLIARQQRQMLDEMAQMRDDMAVLVAITMRLDGTVSGLVQEVRAMHSQHSRLERRVRAIEQPAS